jgi:aspartate/methionine/tyrosine aminotransferase
MYNLGFGYPTCVLETLDMMYKPIVVQTDILNLEYCEYEGKPDLIKHIQKLTGKKHIIITTGCSQAINIALRALSQAEGFNQVLTNKYTFSYYDNIINKANLEHKKIDDLHKTNITKALRLVDIPSNPYGKIESVHDVYNNTIHDEVYNNQVYINDTTPFTVQARVTVGSVSKLLGLTGVRIGYIATDIESDYNLFYNEVKYENCTSSVLSQDLVTNVFNKLDMENFTTIARGRVNYNREQFLKLNSFFDGQEIPNNGMFYVVEVDKKGLSIINRASVTYITLDSGKNTSLIRFNLAANNTLTKNAVNAIKINDIIK